MKETCCKTCGMVECMGACKQELSFPITIDCETECPYCVSYEQMEMGVEG